MSLSLSISDSLSYTQSPLSSQAIFSLLQLELYSQADQSSSQSNWNFLEASLCKDMVLKAEIAR